MNLRTIKRILIFGIFWITFASLLEVIVDHKKSDIIFFITALIGQGIFLFGLFILDRKAKSLLSGYYGVMIVVGLMLYFTKHTQSNFVLSLCLVTLFLILLFRYLQIFTRISGIGLFINSFYTLILCVFVGLVILKFTHIVEHRAVVSFIIGFMIFPSLIMYISAIFSLKSIAFDKLNKTIL